MPGEKPGGGNQSTKYFTISVFRNYAPKEQYIARVPCREKSRAEGIPQEIF
jgi:hypothetical protein